VRLHRIQTWRLRRRHLPRILSYDGMFFFCCKLLKVQSFRRVPTCTVPATAEVAGEHFLADFPPQSAATQNPELEAAATALTYNIVVWWHVVFAANCSNCNVFEEFLLALSLPLLLKLLNIFWLILQLKVLRRRIQRWQLRHIPKIFITNFTRKTWYWCSTWKKYTL